MRISKQAMDYLVDTYGAHDIRADYSGRFMYGDDCIAFTGEPSEITSFTVAVAAAVWATENEEGVEEMLRGMDGLDVLDMIQNGYEFRMDSMGMGNVWYWPDIQAPEGYEMPEDY